jgi:hypothetical protein
MMRALLIILLVASFAHATGQDRSVQAVTPVCQGTNDTAVFGSIISNFGPNTGTIQLPSVSGSRCAVNNLTIPANVTLDNAGGSGIKVNTGQTLRVAGFVTSPPKLLFSNALSGQGTVSFSGNKVQTIVYPEWWGGGADVAAGTNAAAFNAANAALVTIGSGEIKLGPGTYDFNRTFNLGDDAVAFTGISLGGTNGLVGTTLRWTGASDGLAIYCTRLRYSHLHDFQLTNSVAKGTSIGIRLSGPAIGTNNSGVVLDRINVSRFHYGGLIGDGSGGGHDASEVTVFGSTFADNDTGLRIDGFNSLNVNLYATNFESNATSGIHAENGNIAVFGGSYGRNGVDWKQRNAQGFTVIGVRSESARLFDSQATGAVTPVTLTNVDQAAGFPEVSLTGATNTSPIVITSKSHGLTTGRRVFIRGVLGNTATNGPWTITVMGADIFSLKGSAGNGAYTSGGTWFYDHNPVTIGSGTLATLEGCTLKGSIRLNNGFGGAAVIVRNGATPFVSPLDVSDGNGTLAHYTLEHTRRVDAAGLQVEMFNESGMVVGTVLVPSSLSGTATLEAGIANITLAPRLNANYKISLSSNANEIMRWSSKATTGFTITSSNAASRASVDWRVEN